MAGWPAPPPSTETSAFFGPKPTGIATIDTPALNNYIAAEQALGRTPVVTQPGTFVVNNSITAGTQTNASNMAWGGPTQTIKASTTFPTTKPLVTTRTTTAKLNNPVWTGSPTFNANGRAAHAFYPKYFTKFWWLGRPAFQSAPQGEVVIGVPTTTGAKVANGFKLVGGFQFAGTPSNVGYASLTVNASDCIIENLSGHSQETALWNNSSNNVYYGAHMSNTTITQGYRDTGTATLFIGCVGDSYKFKGHTATGSTGSSVLTDATIRPLHQGLRIVTRSGASTASSGHIPATTFVGTVTSGTSFIMVNKTGTAVNATGAVSKIALVATSYMLRGHYGQLVGSRCESNKTYGTVILPDAINVGAPTGTSATTAYGYTLSNFFVWGKNTTQKKFARALTGNYQGTHTGTRCLVWRGFTTQDVTASFPIAENTTAVTTTGTLTATVVKPDPAQTSHSGSAGTVVSSEPFSGTTYKKVVVVVSGYTTTSTYTYAFPTAFTAVAAVTGNSTALSPTVTTAHIVIPVATASSGVITVEGY